MKNRILWLLPVLIFLASCKKDEPFDASLVKKIMVQSAYTGSTYPVYIVLPENYDSGKKYETLYALDGDDDLNGIKIYEQIGWTCRQASSTYNKQNIVIVAIGSLGQDERFRDYSPVPNLGKPKGIGGGSENYAKFIMSELIPKIQQEYSVDTTQESRIIIGHSLGGTFTGFMFTKHPEVFSNYLTLSPAFWWGDGTILDYENETRAINSSRKSLVYVSCGEFEEGIRILAKEWHYRLDTFYPDCSTDFHMVNMAGHISSAKESINKSIDFYFKNK
jgi:hypothetical protein